MSRDLTEIKEKSIPILKQYGITHADLFGSYARGQEHAGSDIDLLIHMGRTINLIEFIRMKQQLEAALNKSVDLVSDDAIIPQFESSIRESLVNIL